MDFLTLRPNEAHALDGGILVLSSIGRRPPAASDAHR
jgi:hypothetical protein